MQRRRGRDPLPVDGTFALLLTHDLDRPYKSLQAPYYAAVDRDPRHLGALRPDVNPWWQFETVMDLESDLGVRSAFYLLGERPMSDRPPGDWLDPKYWIEHLGRYDPADPAIAEAVGRLAEGGWEIGLHGSYDSYDDPDRLAREKRTIESIVDEPVVGGRQHHLNLSIPETWRHHSAIGLGYDSTLGPRTSYGFRFGYRELRPFDDEFVVFPMTLMEKALPSPDTDFETARDDCDRLLEEAADNAAVMTVLWHPRTFAAEDFPGHRRLYRWLIERARELGAWIGPPRDLYRRLDPPDADRRAGDRAPGRDDGARTST